MWRRATAVPAATLAPALLLLLAVVLGQAAARPTIILVPGIGGSRLECRHLHDDPSTEGIQEDQWHQCWYHTTHFAKDGAEKESGTYFLLPAVAPSTRDSVEVRPYGGRDGDGLAAVETLGPSTISFSSLVQFQKLSKALQSAGYRAGEDLFGFGYVWFHSNVQSGAELADFIAKRALGLSDVSGLQAAPSGAAEHDGFIIVCHSMGGLVTKSALAQYPGLAAYMRHFISAGTPYQGSPDSVFSLINGANMPLNDPAVTTYITRHAASVYELLPSATAQWPSSQEVRVTSGYAGSATGITAVRTLLEGQTLGSLEEDPCVHHPYQPGQAATCQDDPNTIDYVLWDASRQFRETLANYELPGWVRLYTIFLAGTDTRIAADYGAASASTWPATEPKYTFGPGDGTVPSFSASTFGKRAKPEHSGAEKKEISSVRHSGWFSSKVTYLQHPDMMADSQVIDAVMRRLGLFDTLAAVGVTLSALVTLGGGAYVYRRRRASKHGRGHSSKRAGSHKRTGGSHGSRSSRRRSAGSSRKPGSAAGSRGSRRPGSRGSRASGRGSNKDAVITADPATVATATEAAATDASPV